MERLGIDLRHDRDRQTRHAFVWLAFVGGTRFEAIGGDGPALGIAVVSRPQTDVIRASFRVVGDPSPPGETGCLEGIERLRWANPGRPGKVGKVLPDAPALRARWLERVGWAARDGCVRIDGAVPDSPAGGVCMHA
jgi:hypothetical protein